MDILSVQPQAQASPSQGGSSSNAPSVPTQSSGGSPIADVVTLSSAVQQGSKPSEAPAAPVKTFNPEAEKAVTERVSQARQDASRKEQDISKSSNFDDEINRMIYRVVNDRTGEVIRQIPEEAMVKLAKAIRAMDNVPEGIFIKGKA